MKSLKIAVVILGPLVLIVGLYFALSNRSSSISSRVTLVDVTTGKTRAVSSSSIKMLPAPNEAGEFVLFPVMKNEAGQWVIPDRYRDAVRELGKEGALRVNPETLTLADTP